MTAHYGTLPLKGPQEVGVGFEPQFSDRELNPLTTLRYLDKKVLLWGNIKTHRLPAYIPKGLKIGKILRVIETSFQD